MVNSSENDKNSKLEEAIYNSPAAVLSRKIAREINPLDETKESDQTKEDE